MNSATVNGDGSVTLNVTLTNSTNHDRFSFTATDKSTTVSVPLTTPNISPLADAVVTPDAPSVSLSGAIAGTNVVQSSDGTYGFSVTDSSTTTGFQYSTDGSTYSSTPPAQGYGTHTVYVQALNGSAVSTATQITYTVESLSPSSLTISGAVTKTKGLTQDITFMPDKPLL